MQSLAYLLEPLRVVTYSLSIRCEQ